MRISRIMKTAHRMNSTISPYCRYATLDLLE